MVIFEEDLREAVDSVRHEFGTLELASPLLTVSFSGTQPFPAGCSVGVCVRVSPHCAVGDVVAHRT
jgi:hypothetical protein